MCVPIALETQWHTVFALGAWAEEEEEAASAASPVRVKKKDNKIFIA
jgi:hypothetical protein